MRLSQETKHGLIVGGAVVLALIVLGSIIGSIISLVFLVIKGILSAVIGLIGFAFKSIFNLLVVGGLGYLGYRWYHNRGKPVEEEVKSRNTKEI